MPLVAKTTFSKGILLPKSLTVAYLSLTSRKTFVESHLELIHRQDQNSIQQSVDSVLRVRAIAQLADVHLRPPLNMLVPFKGLDAIVIKLFFCGFMILFLMLKYCHITTFLRQKCDIIMHKSGSSYFKAIIKLSGKHTFSTSIAALKSGAISLYLKPAIPQPIRVT